MGLVYLPTFGAANVGKYTVRPIKQENYAIP